MKAIAFGNRLARDLDVTSYMEIPADVRQEMLDAINGGLQKLHALAPHESKITTASIPLYAPETVSIGVTNGSTTITGYDFVEGYYYRTIRVAGDSIDNQVMGTNELLHPYGGTTSTVAAVVYGDAVSVVEPYEELVGDLRILETGDWLTNFKRDWSHQQKPVGTPKFYHAEANARNRNSTAPSVLRVDHLPDKLYRLEGKFTLAPSRIVFADLLSPGADIPLRDELVEVYLLPVSRSLMATCRLWRDKTSITKITREGEQAEQRYEVLTPKTLATPNNRVRTKPGW